MQIESDRMLTSVLPRAASILVSACLGTAGIARAETLHVPAEYATIQAAIDATVAGDIVEIAEGVYTGSGNRDLDLAGKAITVRSSSGDPSTCVVDCEYAGRGFVFANGEGPDSVVRDLTITHGFAPEDSPYGGGVYCEAGSPTLQNCIIQDSTTAAMHDCGGGGVYCSDSTLMMVDCLISGNSTKERGGGLLCQGSLGPTLTNCTIRDNEAATGGGLSCRHTSLVDCLITGNIAEEGGGLILSESNTLTACTVSDNRAWLHEGGGVLNFGDATFSDCLITGNWSMSGGSGVDSSRGTETFTRCTISANLSRPGIWLDECRTRFEGCEIIQNTRGGIVCWDALLLTMTDCTIADNVSDLLGSGLSLISGSDAALRRCSIHGNTSYRVGGGIYCSESCPTIVNCSFTDNVAHGSGGAAFLNFDSHAVIVNCVLSGNEGHSDGGAIYSNNGSDPMLVGCTIVGNTSYFGSGGALCADDSAPELINCIVRNNRPGQVSVYWAEPMMQFCNLEAGAGEPWFGVGCIDADPLFLNPAGDDGNPFTGYDNDFRLNPGSPCIDAGDNTAVPADAFDLDDDGDTTEPIPFDLAGNPRFLDDPDTIDTGNPGAPGPLIDIGAYEFQTAPACPGDIDGDGDTDQSDLGLLLVSYEKPPGDPLFNPDADFNGDGQVGQPDLGILLANYGCAP